MYNLSERGVEGIYNANTDTYCVNMKGNTEQKIEDIEKHEYAHWLIDQDNIGHFCKEKN